MVSPGACHLPGFSGAPVKKWNSFLFLVQRRRGFEIVSIRIFVDWRHTGRSGFFTPGGKVCLFPTSASGWVLRRHWWLPQPPRRKEKWQSKNNCHRPKGCVLKKFRPVANGKGYQAQYVSRVVKDNKKSFHHLTMHCFMIWLEIL